MVKFIIEHAIIKFGECQEKSDCGERMGGA